jgi:hypothetical protein
MSKARPHPAEEVLGDVDDVAEDERATAQKDEDNGHE